MFQKYANEYKTSYLWHTFLITVYNVTKADDLRELMHSSENLVRGKLYEFGKSFLGNGILISEGQAWQTSRNILSNFFNFNFYKDSVKGLTFETEHFLREIENLNEKPVNLQNVFSEFILNTFCKCVLGVKFDSKFYLENIREIDRMFGERFGKLPMYSNLIYNIFGNGRKFQETCNKLRMFTSQMVRRRKQNPGKLLDHLLNSDLSENAVCDELDNLLIAGFDTTSTVLSFIIHKLSTNPEIQDIAYQEIFVNDYTNQQFLECIIKEGLRLYPGVPKLHRTITTDIICGNVKFSKGTEVSINIFDIHRDEKYFPNPEKFYPQRFSSENSRNRHPYVFVPFSFGSRKCLGTKFALLEMKIILSNILRTYFIRSVGERKTLHFRTGLLLRSCEDLYVKFEKRK